MITSRMRKISWRMVATHLVAIALGIVLGFQIPVINHRYQLHKELDQIELQIKEDPNSADNWSSVGVLKSGMNDDVGATVAFKKAMELDSSNGTAYIGMGNLFYKNGDYDEAEKWYSGALQVAQKKNSTGDIFMAQQLLKLAQARKAGRQGPVIN